MARKRANGSYQAFDYFWATNDVNGKFAKAAGITQAQAAAHLALLANVIMDGTNKTGCIDSIDKRWLARVCLWPGTQDSFFQALRDSDLCTFDEEGYPVDLDAEKICGDRIAAYRKQSAYNKDYYEAGRAAKTTLTTETTGTTDTMNKEPSERLNCVKSDSRFEQFLNLTTDDLISVLNDVFGIGLRNLDGYKGIDPRNLIWAGMKSMHAKKPGLYFRRVVDNKRRAGVFTFDALADAEHITDQEADFIEAHSHGPVDIERWKSEFRNYQGTNDYPEPDQLFN